MADWYYKQGDQELGPVSRAELEYLLNTAAITTETLVRSESTAAWKAVGATRKARPGRLSKSTTTPAAATDAKGKPSSIIEESQIGDETPGTVEPTNPAKPDLEPHEKDATKRQAAIGTAIVLVALLLIALFWSQYPSSSTAGGSGGNGLADGDRHGTGEAQIDGATARGDSTQGDGTPAPPASDGADATSNPLATSEANASQVAGKDFSTTTGSERSIAAEPAISTESGVPDDPKLSNEATDRSDAIVAGDPQSKFTIAAPGEATFFGLRATGRRFVFVVDRSGSMGGEPLERAKEELMKCIRNMPARVEVLVIFFDDAALPDIAGYRKADRQSTADLQTWIDSVSPGGGTNVTAGMQHAFAQRKQPDAVFLLTDGAFDAGTPNVVQQLNADANVRINTVALVSDAGEHLLKQIARQNNGDYRFVP